MMTPETSGGSEGAVGAGSSRRTIGTTAARSAARCGGDISSSGVDALGTASSATGREPDTADDGRLVTPASMFSAAV
jgi:hypothetical protein